jgi:H+-transporting ATPase
MPQVRREGKVEVMPAKFLVPGDVVLVKLGDIVAADCVIIDGTLLCDQAALTGESLPVQLYPGDSCKMGSTIKRGQRRGHRHRHQYSAGSDAIASRTGEAEAHVMATGKNTFFGRAATMVQSVRTEGRFQQVLQGSWL